VRLNRAVAVGEADGPQAGLAALGELDPTLPRYTASAAYLHERAGDFATASELYVQAAAQAHNIAERNHLTLRAATLRQQISAGGGS
jgi:predicted RNA polymerase sigma factor